MNSILAGKNLSQTKFRTQLLDIVSAKNYALSQKEIEEDLGEFDRITLYRTIKLFLEKGILHSISIHGETKYALCSHDCSADKNYHVHNHIHLFCKSCENVFCIEASSQPQTINAPNVQIDNLEIQADGICENCLSGR